MLDTIYNGKKIKNKHVFIGVLDYVSYITENKVSCFVVCTEYTPNSLYEDNVVYSSFFCG